MRRWWTSLLCCIAAAIQVAAAAPSTLYFIEDFSNPREPYFFTGEQSLMYFRYRDGGYEIDTMASETYGQSVLVDSLNNYRVEATARVLDSREAGEGKFGLSFNYRDREGSSDFLLFLVYDRGAFTVLRYLDNRTSVLFSPTKTRLFKSGELVTLTVDAAGGACVFYINGVEVARMRDDDLTSGGYGLFASAGSQVFFDDFKVFAEQTTPQPIVDDFSGDKTLFEGDWGEASYSYAGGRYIVDTLNSDYVGLSQYPKAAGDFELTVDVEFVSGDSTSGYGIYARDYVGGQGGFNQYRFLLSEEWYGVEQSEPGLPMGESRWEQHSAVRDTGVNTLMVRLVGPEISFFVNGVEVWSGIDEHSRSGTLGLFVSAGQQVAFDNLKFVAL